MKSKRDDMVAVGVIRGREEMVNSEVVCLE